MFYDRNSTNASYFKEELPFLDQLQNKLDKKSAELKGKYLRGSLFQELSNSLKKYREGIKGNL